MQADGESRAAKVLCQDAADCTSSVGCSRIRRRPQSTPVETRAGTASGATPDKIVQARARISQPRLGV